MSLRFLAGLALALARARAASAAAPRWTSSPPLGWNPCNGFQCHMSAIGEPVLREIADAIAASGLRDAGYTLFSLDDGWSGPRDPASGALTANASAFPSGTLAPLAAHVAALGLELGAYADRGGLTCEKLPGSLGREALDAATLAGWGVVFLKEDSCNASEIEAARRAEYGAMAAAAAESGLFLSVCGWAPTYAGFGALDPPIGGAWRLGPDAGPWPRFLIGLEGAAGASAFAGPGRGWPDLDMLAGNTGSVQEIFRLSAAAVVGSVLLLSWDVRNASASDLPLSTYLNPPRCTGGRGAALLRPRARRAGHRRGGSAAAGDRRGMRRAGGAVALRPGAWQRRRRHPRVAKCAGLLPGGVGPDPGRQLQEPGECVPCAVRKCVVRLELSAERIHVAAGRPDGQ